MEEKFLEGYSIYTNAEKIQEDVLTSETELGNVGTSVSLTVSYSASVSWSWSWSF